MSSHWWLGFNLWIEGKGHKHSWGHKQSVAWTLTVYILVDIFHYPLLLQSFVFLSFTHSNCLSTSRARSRLKVFLARAGMLTSIGFWLYSNGIKLNKYLMITTIMTVLLLTTIIAANIYLMHTYIPGTMLGTLHGVLLNPHSYLLRYKYIPSILLIRKLILRAV